ncbi:MAG: hypothetical protein ACREQK_08260 [Candidatus Binatia bacterium]
MINDRKAAERHPDNYGRTKTYAYLEDGTLVEKETTRQGYGLAYSRFRYRPLTNLFDLVRQAREKNRLQDR